MPRNRELTAEAKRRVAARRKLGKATAEQFAKWSPEMKNRYLRRHGTAPGQGATSLDYTPGVGGATAQRPVGRRSRATRSQYDRWSPTLQAAYRKRWGGPPSR